MGQKLWYDTNGNSFWRESNFKKPLERSTIGASFTALAAELRDKLKQVDIERKAIEKERTNFQQQKEIFYVCSV